MEAFLSGKFLRRFLELFCKATWMAFNPQKFVFLEVGWDVEGPYFIEGSLAF
jgi:hypothetical protein